MTGLSRDFFLTRMTTLKQAYVNFGLNIEDSGAMVTWYEQFSGFPNETFDFIVKCFIRTNRYPPMSPFDLKDSLIQYLKGTIDSNCSQMFMWVYGCIVKYDLAYRKDNQEKFMNAIRNTYGETAYRTWFRCGSYIMCEFPDMSRMGEIWSRYYKEESEGVAVALYNKCGKERLSTEMMLRLAKVPLLDKTQEELRRLIDNGKPEAIGDSHPREIPGSKK